MKDIIAARLAKEMKERRAPSNTQCGPCKPLPKPFQKVLSKAHQEQAEKPCENKFNLTLLLYVENAINKAGWQVIMMTSEKKGISPFQRWIISFCLDDSKLDEIGCEQRQILEGVLQKSIFGATLWNLVCDDVLAIPGCQAGS